MLFPVTYDIFSYSDTILKWKLSVSGKKSHTNHLQCEDSGAAPACNLQRPRKTLGPFSWKDIRGLCFVLLLYFIENRFCYRMLPRGELSHSCSHELHPVTCVWAPVAPDSLWLWSQGSNSSLLQELITMNLTKSLQFPVTKMELVRVSESGFS